MLPTDAPAFAPCVCGLSVDVRSPRFLLECHYCGRWCHGDCVRVAEREALQIAKFACAACAKRGHATERYQYSENAPALDVDELSFAPLPIQRRAAECVAPMSHRKNSEAFRRVLKTAVYARSGVRSVLAQDMDATYFALHALDQPVLALHGSSGNRGPSHLTRLPAITARDVAQLLETRTSVAVSSVDVESQAVFALSPRAWGDKVRASLSAGASGGSPAHSSGGGSQPLNAIFSLRGTPFAPLVAAPEAVAAVDWRSSLLPYSDQQQQQQQQQQQPKAGVVGCFLGANAFLDFQIAPGGRNAWLSVSTGELWAFLIPPTASHLRAFQQWKAASSSSPSSSSSSPSNAPPSARVFLAELVDKCIKSEVPAGATLVVPAGFALALFAAQGDDCSFFSGLFSATSALDTQLQVVLDLELPQQRQQQQSPTATASIWSVALDAADTSVLAAGDQVWAAIALYSRRLAAPSAVGDVERLALRRALPLLRRWSAATAPPASVAEAQHAIARLEQALDASTRTAAAPSPSVSHYGALPFGGGLLSSAGLSPMAATSASAPLPPLSATEASYIYSAAGAADDWPLQDAAGGGGLAGLDVAAEGFAPAAGFHSPAPAAWADFQHQEQPFAMPPEHAQPFYPSAMFTPLGGSAPTYLPPTSSFFGAAPPPTGSVPPPSGLALAADALVRHRASCHRCGNLRKKNVRCPACPHIFCHKCAEKMVEEHGDTIFSGGCPVCKERCCCGKNRSATCARKYHCYKKCPSTKRPAA